MIARVRVARRPPPTRTKNHPSCNGLIRDKRLGPAVPFPLEDETLEYSSEISRYRPVDRVRSAVEAPAARPCPRCGRVCLACSGQLARARARSAGAFAPGGNLLLPWFATPQSDGQCMHWQQGGVEAADGGRPRASAICAASIPPPTHSSSTRRCGRSASGIGVDDLVLVGPRLT